MFLYKTLFLVTLFLVIVCASSVGCGYTLRGSGSVLPPDIKTIYIPMVENNTTYPALTQLVTEELRDSFERYGVVEISEVSGKEDAILSAKINKVDKTVGTVTSNTVSALQYELSLNVSAELRKNDGTLLWSDRSLSVRGTYGADAGVVVASSPEFAGGTLSAGDLSRLDSRELARGQEQQVLENLSQELAKRIYDQSVAPEF